MKHTKRYALFALVVGLLASAATAYDFDASDFATEVVRYTPGSGTGLFNDANAALGRPTVDTDPDFTLNPAESIPVVPVYPAWGNDQIVTVGNGGELIVAFDHPITDDPDNPFGVDLIVFGNSFMSMDFSGGGWDNRDPNAKSVGGGGFTEAATVSVSKGFQGLPGEVAADPDTWQWHTFTAGPGVDEYAPTLGRAYDETNPHQPDASWAWNQWWGRPTDPTLPVDPSLTFADHAGQTVRQVADSYYHAQADAYAAGGTGFDLADLAAPLDWFRYVRVDNSSTAEVDAFSDVAALFDCAAGDLNCDTHEDADDIDYLFARLTGEGGVVAQTRLDFDGDHDADQADVTHLVEGVLGTRRGDTNLDGKVSLVDLNVVGVHFGAAGGWAAGDFSGDGRVTLVDLNELGTHFGFDASAAPAAVPEPTSLLVFVLMGAVCVRRGHLSDHAKRGAHA